ncbi:hypothetical protein DPMN_114272 [Dreissena polymorpha]|uniref:Uncharacterized protein n=1 Tax=Dreissena polymorpha TaxID=45954 RepID=A0A9D4KJK5_DREPO|nr:hypothetical protein DPMN_114272 [Dreissena polymorpha]
MYGQPTFRPACAIWQSGQDGFVVSSGEELCPLNSHTWFRGPVVWSGVSIFRIIPEIRI